MPGGLGIHLFALCHDEARMLPFFFRHYDSFIDRYHIYDASSTDGSFDILEANGRVTAMQRDIRKDSYAKLEQILANFLWKSYRSKADWVIVTNIDEQIFHPDLLAYLERCRADGVTAIKAPYYEMAADEFPDATERLTDSITRGYRSPQLDRLAIFNPKVITDTHFTAGLQSAAPEGTVVWPKTSELLLLRYRQLGAEYASAEQAGRAGGGGAAQAQELLEKVAPVPGLGHNRQRAAAPAGEHAGLIEHSGLFDEDWYRTKYPDTAELDEPLEHFCETGWREGRSPNPYFDTEWYAATYLAAAQREINPLVHYIQEGERSGASPSEHFDAQWYRAEHDLHADERALSHFLRRRTSGKVSPRPDFDVEAYCRAHPEVLTEGLDPYEHSLAEATPDDADGAEEAAPVIGSVPSYEMIEDLLGMEPGADPPKRVSWDNVEEIIKLFLARVEVDEAWYCEAYPDVAEAIREGGIASAAEHFRDSGYFEGRAPRADAEE
jgi:hypothetical protein